MFYRVALLAAACLLAALPLASMAGLSPAGGAPTLRLPGPDVVVAPDQ